MCMEVDPVSGEGSIVRLAGGARVSYVCTRRVGISLMPVVSVNKSSIMYLSVVLICSPRFRVAVKILEMGAAVHMLTLVAFPWVISEGRVPLYQFGINRCWSRAVFLAVPLECYWFISWFRSFAFSRGWSVPRGCGL